MKTVDIIIVNWNAGRQLVECLTSFACASRLDVHIQRVVVVDNASKDLSMEEMETIPLPLEIVRNAVNRGFAAACNQGARNSKADYLLFLNPDTLLFENSLTIPLDFMEKQENAKVAIVGIQLTDELRRVNRSCTRFPTHNMLFVKLIGLSFLFPKTFKSHFMTEWAHQENSIVDHVIGAFYLVRRKVFQELCGFDERFFVYLEDLDFSLRAKKAGWKCYYLADARAFHKGGGTSEQAKAARLFYSLSSKILYGYKHFSKLSASLLMLETILLEPIFRIVFAAVRGSCQEVKETCKAYGMLLKDSSKLFRQIAN